MMTRNVKYTKLFFFLLTSATVFCFFPLCIAETSVSSGVKKIGQYAINHDWVYARKDISGIARVSLTHGLLAVDEGVFAQRCIFDDATRTIQITDPVKSLVGLLPESTKHEMDTEGVVVIGNTYYLTGSHGMAKKSGRYQKSRHTCCRFKVNPKTGEVVGKVEVANLAPILKNDPVLRLYYKKILQQKGLNIEGLAAKHGELYFGFRAPNINGNTFILKISPEELFEVDVPKKYYLYSVPIRKAMGIRDIISVSGGFLFIAGTAGVAPGNSQDPDTKSNVQDWAPDLPYLLYFWDGKDNAKLIGEIPRDDKRHKAEAMLLLKETDTQIELLILFDGAKGGNPIMYQINH